MKNVLKKKKIVDARFQTPTMVFKTLAVSLIVYPRGMCFLLCVKIVFVKFVGLKSPDSTNSWVEESMDFEECKDKCLNNCNCTAFTNSNIRYGISGCAMWFGDLIDIRQIAANNRMDVDSQNVYIRMSTSEKGNVPIVFVAL